MNWRAVDVGRGSPKCFYIIMSAAVKWVITHELLPKFQIPNQMCVILPTEIHIYDLVQIAVI